MLAVSGTLYRLYANVLRDLVTSWCEAKKKIPDTQLGFYPRRNTLQPISIFRHLQHAAQAKHPSNLPRLHTTFVDSKQAYDTIPQEALWPNPQEAHGSTCTAFACLPPCSTLKRICTQKMQSFWWMVLSVFVPCPHEESNRAALCPLSYLYSKSMILIPLWTV